MGGGVTGGVATGGAAGGATAACGAGVAAGGVRDDEPAHAATASAATGTSKRDMFSSGNIVIPGGHPLNANSIIGTFEFTSQ